MGKKTELRKTKKRKGDKVQLQKGGGAIVNGKKLSRAQYDAYRGKTSTVPEEKAQKGQKTGSKGSLALDPLLSSSEYKSLPKDQQEAVRAVYMAIGENNIESAEKLISAFGAAEKIADPFFKQQIRLAKDAVKRGYVSIDKELDFEVEQSKARLKDLKEDIALRSEYLTIEEQNALKGIEREYEQNLKTTRNSLASAGFGSSSIRNEKESILEETTGELKETTSRRFGYERAGLESNLARETRDTRAEVARLTELAKQNKMTLGRDYEGQLGSDGLPRLSGYKPIGDIYGSINTAKQNDILTGVRNLIF